MLAVWFFWLFMLLMSFIELKNFSSISSMLSVSLFIMKGAGICHVFYVSIDMIMLLLSFILFLWCITSIGFWMLNESCILKINPIWSWYVNPFTCLQIWVYSILLSIFTFIFIRDIGLQSSHFVFVWFRNQGETGLI